MCKDGDIMRILIAAAECVPFAKTGGLADVVGALPKFLKRKGHDARVILPLHHIIKEKYCDRLEHLYSFSVDLGWRSHYAGLEKLEYAGIVYYFVDNEYYFGDSIYRGGNAEGEQYCFFSRVVAEAMPLLDFVPDILHLNDWHTAVLPLLLKTQYGGRPQHNVKTLLTIHNIAYQGKFSLDFARDMLGISDQYLTPCYMEHYGAADFLKAGCVFADKLNTVSPSYAEEILDDYYGEGLSGILRNRRADLCGILNGLDTDIYNPATDKALYCNFGIGDIQGKQANKASLLYDLGLCVTEDVPLLAMVSRLTEQKGLDLLLHVLEPLMCRSLAVVILGTGEQKYEQALRSAEQRYRGRFCAYIGYNEAVSRRIYAGSDFYLMPSRFEPCGLSQMIAMRYGSLPIVRETGGLRDSVQPYNKYTGQGTGFSFANYNAHELLDTIDRALGVYTDRQTMAQLIRSAMLADFGFTHVADAYDSLYRSML